MKTGWWVIALVAAAGAWAQGTMSVAFSDPARPKTVRASVVNGSLAVMGYDGNELQIETPGGGRTPRAADGLRRLGIGNGVTAEEENNVIRVRGPRNGSMTMRVPFNTSLKLECTNGGHLKVEHVNGDLELSNVNGDVVAAGVSGSVVANSMNGRVLISIDKVTPGKPMSFTTMNGDVDVTLPADVQASVRMKADNGDAFSDFDMKLSAPSTQVAQEARSKGKYKVKIDKTTTGTINGGGPAELSFKSFNGNIYIRKKK